MALTVSIRRSQPDFYGERSLWLPVPQPDSPMSPCSDTRYRRCVFQNSTYIDRQQGCQALGRNGGRIPFFTPQYYLFGGAIMADSSSRHKLTSTHEGAETVIRVYSLPPSSPGAIDVYANLETLGRLDGVWSLSDLGNTSAQGDR